VHLFEEMCKLPPDRLKYEKRSSPTSNSVGVKMGTKATAVLYVLLMAAIVVAVDFLFFRSRFWERLIVNIGIVLVFAAFYLRFLKRL
jgi:hypothetical protein